MSFVHPQGGRGGRNAGIAVAIVFHVVLIWALANGLARKIVQVINEPIEMKVIEEVKPPPPKVIEMPPPPKLKPPPPAYVPPPEVQVTPPSAAAPVITATVSEPPPAPPPVAPRAEAPEPPPPVAPAPKPAPAPAPVSAGVACPNFSKVMGEAGYPREAQRAGLEEGSALIQFTLGAAGEVKDIKALQSSHGSFAKGAMRIVAEYKCQGQGREITVQVPFVFKSS